MNRFKSTTLLLTYFLIFLFCVDAQTSGVITGKVTGPDGKPIPSASITVTGPSGTPRTALAGKDGSFTVNGLPPGTYRIDVQMNGFAALTQNDVQVSTGSPSNLTLTLQQGTGTGRVQAQTQTSMIQEDNAAITRTYSSVSLTDLPIQDLNNEQLVEKMPGVSPPLTFAAANPQNTSADPLLMPTVANATLLDPQHDRVWSTNGQPALANNILTDGAENYEPVNGIEVHVPTLFSEQEMKVTTSNYQAEEGRAGGTVLTNVIRTGSNAVHAELFEFHSDDWLRARDYFDPFPLSQSRYVSNRYGGVVDGPVVHNKTFLMLSYQGDHLADDNPTFTTVPSATLASGNFSGFPAGAIVNPGTGLPFTGNMIPAGLINPVAARLIAAMPLPNVGGQEYNYFANVPFKNVGNRVDARLDQHFSDKTSMSVRYGLSYYDTYQGAVLPGLSADGGSSQLRAHDGLLSIDHVFGATTFATLQVGMTRYSDPIYPLSSYSASSFGFTGGDGTLPYIQIAGMTPLGVNPSYPQLNREDTYSIRNNWNARVLNQDIRFGIDIWAIRFDGFQNLPYGPGGGYTFSSAAVPGTGSYALFPDALAAFLMGAPTTSGIISSYYTPSYMSWQIGGYLADRVKFRRLTLDLGVRYDYFRPIQPRDNAADYSVLNPGTGILTALGSGVDRYGGQPGNDLNFAPRIGIAYKLNDRTVFRTGYGMTYWDPVQYEASTLLPTFTGAGFGTAGTFGVAPGVFGVIPAASVLATDRNVPLYYSDGNMKTPYVQFYNFTVQRDLFHGILADIGYVGNVGRDLPFTQNTNAALPGTGVARLPFAGAGITAPTYLRGTGYSSNYNALQLNVTKRFSEGFSFSFAYTLSKAMDYGQGLTPFLNNVDPVANYGPSNFDRTNVINITHNWRLPVGTGSQHLNSGVLGHVLGPWQLDGIFTWGSGLPVTPIASTAICDCPGNVVTASALPAGVAPSSVFAGYPGYAGLFSSVAPTIITTSQNFVQPAADSFGNLGRNSLRGPDFTNYNLAITRSFLFVEKTRLEFRAEAYNLANSSNFTNPFLNVNAFNFGQASSTAYGMGPRTLQLAVKVVF